jgi:hypothetical protein
MVARKLSQHVPPDRTAPIIFQVTKPVCGLYQRRPFSGGGIGDANSVVGLTKVDLLFHVVRERASAVRRTVSGAGFGFTIN